MKIYETPKGVDEYVKMCEGYDNSQFRDHVLKHLMANSEMLEIGMGPGNDYKWLSEHFQVTGSDYSQEFLKRAKKRFPKGTFVIADAISLEVDRQFDAIYSCKVYQYFELDGIETALEKQYELLKKDGFIIHSFWIGDSVFEQGDTRAIYHDKQKLKALIEKRYRILEEVVYEEFEPGDSLFVLAKKES